MHRLGTSAAVVLIAALDVSWPAAASECTCRALGRNFELGQTACLMSPKGPRLATCGMVHNNTSWAFSESPCTLSEVSPSRPALAQQDHASVGAVNIRAALLR